MAEDPKYDGYQRDFAEIICNCFDRKIATTHPGTGISSNLDSANQN